MKAPITPAQAWAALAEHYGWTDGSKAELPVLPDHPEPRTMRWSRLEEDAIQAYGAACAAHARELAISETVSIAYGYADNLTWNDSFKAEIKALKGK